MQLHANLSFDGRCEQAFLLYGRCLSGNTTFLMRYQDSPAGLEVPPDWGQKVAHATFTAGAIVICGADVPPERYQKPQGFALQLNLSDPLEAERIFQALKDGGTVQMPLQETFWALRFGMVTDQFGIPWLLPAPASSHTRPHSRVRIPTLAPTPPTVDNK